MPRINTVSLLKFFATLLPKNYTYESCFVAAFLQFGFTNAMMTSSNGNIFRESGPLWRESTGDRWISLTKASGAKLWCFLWPSPEQTVEQTIETSVIWDAIAPIMTTL